MKSMISSVFLATGMMFLISGLSSAQPARGSNARQMYNPATETTFKGTIEAVTQGARGQMMGTHIAVKEGEETRNVMLGPSSFIASKEFKFAKGDSVEVTGSRVTMGAAEYVIAREVVKDGETLTLRDKNGTPAWAGAQMGPGHMMPMPH